MVGGPKKGGSISLQEARAKIEDGEGVVSMLKVFHWRRCYSQHGLYLVRPRCLCRARATISRWWPQLAEVSRLARKMPCLPRDGSVGARGAGVGGNMAWHG